eukprot:597998_1
MSESSVHTMAHMEHACNLTWSISHLTVSIILTIISLPLVISFVQQYITSKYKLAICMLSLICIFTLETFSILLFMAYQDIYCIGIPDHAQYHEYHQVALIAMYFVQMYSVCLLFYLRLYNVFKNGSRKLSKCTHIIYTTLFIYIAASAPVIFVLWKWKPIKSIGNATIFFAITASIVIALNISVAVVFASKLLILHKMDHSEDRDESLQFISAVTKTTILIMFSSIATVIHVICVVVRGFAYSETIHWIMRYSLSFDVFTNFFCVALSHKLLDKYYQIMCGSMHHKCKMCCHRMSQSDTPMIIIEHVSKHHPQANNVED